MSAEIIKVFEYIGDKLGIAIDWTQENIMPYLEDLVARFVKLNIIEDIIGIIVWGIILIGCIVLGITIITKYYKCDKAEGTKGDSIFWRTRIRCYSEDETEMTTPCMVCVVFAIVLVICSLVGLPICVSELIKWIYIPEFQIAEEVSYILQGM